MTPRDANLLPRLLLALDTLNSDAEISETVRQVRRILATDGRRVSDLGGVNQPLEDQITLADNRHWIASRLHALGTWMRNFQIEDARGHEVIERVRLAMIVGSMISGADLRETLAFLRVVIEHMSVRAMADFPTRRLRPVMPDDPDDYPHNPSTLQDVLDATADTVRDPFSNPLFKDRR